MECGRLQTNLYLLELASNLLPSKKTVSRLIANSSTIAWTMLIKIGVMQFSNKEINLDIVELLGRILPNPSKQLASRNSMRLRFLVRKIYPIQSNIRIAENRRNLVDLRVVLTRSPVGLHLCISTHLTFSKSNKKASSFSCSFASSGNV